MIKDVSDYFVDKNKKLVTLTVCLTQLFLAVPTGFGWIAGSTNLVQ